MRIVSLKAENIKKLVAIEITPKGNIVEITGENGSGKTSILDALFWALAGLTNVQDKPIRQGQKKGLIELDLGEFKVTRTFTLKENGEEYSTSLKVVNADGFSSATPQTVLDKIFGKLSFDPLLFSRMDDKSQIDQLKSLVKGFDFKASEKQEKDTYDERTVVNRRAKEASLTHVSFKDVPAAEPTKGDTKTLTERLTNASKKNVEIARVQAERNKQEQTIKERLLSAGRLWLDAQTTWTKAEQAFEEAKRKLEEARAALAKEKESYETNQKDADEDFTKWSSSPALEPMEDVDVLKKSLDEAQAVNELWERWQKKNQAKLDIEMYEKQSQELTDKIACLQKERMDAVTSAGLPVEGLGFNEDKVTLNGIPFKQASSAEQLRTSVAIAMALNPTLRFIRVQDGSLLDPKGMEMLAEMASKEDFQIWVEKVDTSGKVGFFMEDGMVKKEN